MLEATTTTVLADLLPHWLFSIDRPEWLLWLWLLIAIPMLVFGADKLVGGAVHLAKALGMSTVLIGATVVSLGTTTPEAVVSVRAAMLGEPDLALGNAVGSVICDSALIFGLCCTLTRLPIDRFILDRHGWLQLGSGALLTATALLLWATTGSIHDVYLPRWMGIVFVGLLVAYMAVSARWARQHPQIVPEEAAVTVKQDHSVLRSVGYLLLLAFGLSLVVLGSELLIGSVTAICERHDVPESVLAATIVALGTSLPELVTAVAAVIKGHPELLVGNIIGADILNVLFVIGASATFMPFEINGQPARGLQITPEFFKLMLPTMMLVLILLRLYSLRGAQSFRRWQGIPLLAIYVAFVTILITVFGVGF